MSATWIASTRELRERNPPPPLNTSFDDPLEEVEVVDSCIRSIVVGPKATYLMVGAETVLDDAKVGVVTDSTFGEIPALKSAASSLNRIVCGPRNELVVAFKMDVFNNEEVKEDAEE